jgi:CO/xanthine dehydrogenase Mo-binding subunit
LQASNATAFAIIFFPRDGSVSHSRLTSLIQKEREETEEPPEEIFSVVGHRIPKYDSFEKVRGAAQFLIDLRLPGMLYGKILRSRYAHARIKNIDTSKAEALEGVVVAITARDTPKIPFGFMKDCLPLKDAKVLSYRDEVAAVAATSERVALKALELIDVEYEPLQPVFDPLEARRDGSPILHPGAPRNEPALSFHFKGGDPESIFTKAERDGKIVVVENTFRLPFMTHTALGTMGALASYEGGTLTVYANTQSPFMYQRELADALGIGGERVRVIQPAIGGAFGRGMDLYAIDVIAALLSMKTSRPVKILLSREEDLSYSPTRQPAVINLKTAVDGDSGKLLARNVKAYLDVGAYVSWGAFDARVMMATSTGLYRVENVQFDAYPIYTNNPSSGTMRGAGNPQITFAIESQMDIIADRLHMDRLKLRLLNANQPGDTTCQGMKITTCAMEETLRLASEKIGWKSLQSRQSAANKKLGIGFATLFHVAGGARVYRSDGCGAMLKIDDFGKVTVFTGMSEIGTGSDTAITQIVAEELGVPISKIVLVNNDTLLKPWDVGIHASRGTFVGGNAALIAARQAKKELLKIGAKVLSEDPSNVEVKNGMIFSLSNPAKSVEYSRALRQAHFANEGRVLMASAFFDPHTEMADPQSFMGNISMTYAFGTQAALVEVDEETGKIEVKKIVAVHDAGRILNPVGAEGQVEGGIVMSLGYSLFEKLELEEGMVMNPSFADYKLATSFEVPEIEVYFVGKPDPAGPFGAKGLGEHGCIPTAAAISNAVSDALGIRLYELPITPEKVLKALKNERFRKDN